MPKNNISLDETFNELKNEELNEGLNTVISGFKRVFSEKKSKKVLNTIIKDARNIKTGKYALTNEQLKVLRLVNKNIQKKILEFRAEVLAPLGYIQTMVKEFGTATTKDVLGLTKREWEQAKESGLRKIEKRKNLPGTIDSNSRKIEAAKASIKKLETIYRALTASGSREIEKKHLLSRLQSFINSKDFLEYARLPKNVSVEEVKNAKRLIEEKTKRIQKLIKDNNEYDVSELKKEISELSKIESGRSDDVERHVVAGIINYAFRKNIVDKITEVEGNFYKDLYKNFIQEMISNERRRIQNKSSASQKAIQKINFTPNEKKVWGIRKDLVLGKNKFDEKHSGDIGNFYLKIREEDFKEKNREDTTYIHQSDKMLQAKKRIENNVYKFKQSLKNEIDENLYKKIENSELLSPPRVAENFTDKEKKKFIKNG